MKFRARARKPAVYASRKHLKHLRPEFTGQREGSRHVRENQIREQFQVAFLSLQSCALGGRHTENEYSATPGTLRTAVPPVQFLPSQPSGAPKGKQRSQTAIFQPAAVG
jgi:hypothetical protein